jgi:biotin transporter BioY
MLLGALVGAIAGFLVGFLVSSYTCAVAASYNCYPTQELMVGLVTVVGLVAGLGASHLSRSMTNKQKTLMVVAVLFLLVVLVVACINRINPWSCPENAFCVPNSGAT